LRYEAAGAAAPEAAAAPAPGIEAAQAAAEEISEEDERSFEEIVLCSSTGEVLYESQADEVERRVRLLELLAKRSELLGRLLPLGLIDRLEIEGKKTRTVAMLQPERKVFVRIGISRGDTEFVEPQL
jgi:flavin-dependent dehydrogenase